MLKQENLIKITRLGVYLALLTPLVYIPQTIFGAVFGKQLFFQIIIEAALPFYLYLVIFNKNLRPHLDRLTKLVLIFFGVIFISSIFGVDFPKSFWGYDERMRGLWGLLHFLALYFYIITFFNTAGERRKIILWTLAVGMASGLWGLGEVFDPALRIDRGRADPRIIGTTGNSIFLAGYTLFIAYLSLYYFFKYRDRFRYPALANFFLAGAIVFYTGTRGALLGLLAGIILLAVLSVFNSSKKEKIFFGSMLGALMLFILLAFVFNIKILKENRYWNFSRILSISLTESTARERFMLWRLSFSAFRERPVLGWGAENYDYVFDKYYNPQFLRFSFSETWADRSHNLFIDWLVMAGAAGLLSYVAMFVFLGLKILEKDFIRKRANAALVSGLAAFAVFGFFGVEDPTIYAAWFFFLAVFYFASNKESDHQSAANIRITDRARVFALMCLIVAALFSMYFYNIKPLYAGMDFIKFKNFSGASENRKKMALKFLDSGTPYADSLRLRFANEIFLDAAKNKDKEFVGWGIAEAIKAMDKSRSAHGMDFSYPFTLGNLYLRKGSLFGDAGDYDRALDYYNEALLLSPKRQAVLFQMSSAFLLQGDVDGAVDRAKEAVALDEGAGEAHWRLALVYASVKNNAEAYKELKRSFDLKFYGNLAEEMKRAASICFAHNDYPCMEREYTMALGRSNDDAGIYAKLAVVYAAEGKYKEAHDAALRAAELDPSLKQEAEEFLRQIGY